MMSERREMYFIVEYTTNGYKICRVLFNQDKAEKMLKLINKYEEEPYEGDE